KAQCFTSLDGVSFAIDNRATTPLNPTGGWVNAPFGTRPAAARVVNSVVQLQGAIANGSSASPFSMPSGMRPVGHTAYVNVDLCNAHKGQLAIHSDGTTTLFALNAFSDAQCFTSLEGASFEIDSNGSQPLGMASGWTAAATLGGGSPAVENIDGV